MFRPSAIVATVLLLVFSTVSCSTEKILRMDSSDPLARDTFSFPEPTANDLSNKLTLWATYYYLPQIQDGSGNFAMRDVLGAELGPKLSLKDWCDSAMEGSVRIVNKNGQITTYNYAGVSSDFKVDCSSVFRFDVSRTKFHEANGPYGDGIQDYILSPYRTLATDATKIAPGTVIYIPEARGAKITLDDGRVITHDGYFFAGDKGGAIKDSHIDVFIATHKSAPFFPWIKSSQDKTFSAFVITDKNIIYELTQLHTLY